MLIEAQMHLECMNEAFLEMERGDMDDERQRVVYAELIARLWASIHLVQSVRMGREDDGLADALKGASCERSPGFRNGFLDTRQPPFEPSASVRTGAICDQSRAP